MSELDIRLLEILERVTDLVQECLDKFRPDERKRRLRKYLSKRHRSKRKPTP